MKLINIQIYLLIIITLIFSNCREKTDIVDIPILEDKIIINAIISPNDTALDVLISKSRPAFGEWSYDTLTLLYLSQQIDSVIIKNTENNQKTTLSLIKETAERPDDYESPLHPSSALSYIGSTSNFPIQEGKTYQLLVLMKNNIKITAQTTIPSIVDTTKINAMDNSIQWTGIKNEPNFYSVEARVIIVFTEVFYDGGEFQRRKYDCHLPLSDELFTDENKDEKIISARLNIEENLETFISNCKADIISNFSHGDKVSATTLEINISSIPKIFYDYLKAIDDYEVYNDGYGSHNNPINIPTNVEGDALGIFSSYNAIKFNISY